MEDAEFSRALDNEGGRFPLEALSDYSIGLESGDPAVRTRD